LEELWILDIPSQSFERYLLGKSGFIRWEDDPVQHVTPSWSPDEDKFVFGGGIYGLEVYDMSTSEQKLITGPRFDLYYAQWSPSGKWIAAMQFGDDGLNRLYIFSPDGSLHSFTDGCDILFEYLWAPEEDKIAFECHGDCDQLCPESCDNLCEPDCENPCENSCPDSNYLWIWDLE
jgi:Tol biopolymer transport system component